MGLEFNKLALDEAKSRGLVVENCDITEYSKKNKNKYDVVCFFQVLEHVFNVEEFLKSSLDCLKKGGKLIIGVPNNNPYLFIHDRMHALNLPPHHAGLWDRKSLRNLEKYFNIKIDKIKFEPLLDLEYFWNVQGEYLKKHSKISYLLFKKISQRFNKLRNSILPLIFKGRNILVIYSKK